MLASAVHNILSFDQLSAKQNFLEVERGSSQLLLDISAQIKRNVELSELLRTVSATIRRMLPCDAVTFHLQDKETSSLRTSMFGSQEQFDNLTPEEHSASEDLYRAFRSGDLAFSKDRSECLAPLIGRTRVGVLELGRSRGHEFLTRETTLLSQVASQVAMAIENTLAFTEINQLKEQLSREKLYLDGEIKSEQGFEELIGRSPAIRAVLQKIETVAPTDATVLICGETGTGKELVARAIHERSSRHLGAFVKLNCAAIPTGLLESELFGHEKGAYTGAVTQRIGRFELANRGTAFLDEIGEISLELQPKLLRVLQEREFERLGSARTIKTDARLVAATNRNLAAYVEDGSFRADLFYRLNVFPIYVPPLRERPEDIPLLVRHFVQQYARRMNRTIDTVSSQTMETLVRYSWPGNIRQLQNVIERSVILSHDSVLTVPLADLRCDTTFNRERANCRTLEEVEREHILSMLNETKWIISGSRGAAKRLGLNRSTLQFRMNKLGIVRPWMQ